MANLDECKICGTDLEVLEYGHSVPKGNSPYGLKICYQCLWKIKIELAEMKKAP